MIEKLPVLVEREVLKLDEHQLRLLNHLIVERLKFINSSKDLQALSKFLVGDTVSFINHGEEIKGRVVRINRRTLSVITMDNRTKWTIHPDFIKKVSGIEEYDNSNSDDSKEVIIDNIIPINKNENKKISRNAPCPCGSGKKYKRCCGK